MHSISVQKTPLALRSLAVLRAALECGQLGPVLPPERELSVSTEVSRPVLREALLILENEGLIERKGRKRVVVPQGTFPGGTVEGVRQVLLLCRRSWELLENDQAQINEYLAGWLARKGISFRVEVSVASYSAAPGFHLKDLIARNPNTLWLLHRSTEAMQHWFEKKEVDCVVLGGVYPGISLPSVNVDYQAVCRHAAGLLRARGHFSAAIICRERFLPGDLASVEGFTSGWITSGGTLFDLKTKCHDGTEESIVQGCAGLLRLKRPPSAWFVFGSRSCFTIFSWLVSQGKRVGADVHLLSRDSNYYFGSFYGGIAHYEKNLQQQKGKIRKAVDARIARRGGKLATKNLVEATFVDGRSLGRL